MARSSDRRRPRGGCALPRSAVLVVALATLVLAASAGAALPPPRPLPPPAQAVVCGLHDPLLDRLFGCAAQTPPPPSAPPPSSPPAAPAPGGTASSPTPNGPSAPSTPPAASAVPAALQDIAAHQISLTLRFVPGELMIRFTPGTTAKQQAYVLAEARVTVNHRIAPLGVVVVNVS